MITKKKNSRVLEKNIMLLAALAALLIVSHAASATGSLLISGTTVPASVTQGDSFSIVMSITGSEATSVKASLTLPSGLSCTPSGTVDVSLDASGSGTATFSCTADAAADYSNAITESITGTDSGSGASLSDSAQTGIIVQSPASLLASSSIAAASVTNTGSTTFTVSVHNAGGTATTYAIALSSSPSGITFSPTSASGTIGSDSIANKAFTVSSSTLNNYTITATITGNGQTLTERQNLTITAAVAGSGGSGGSGGGGTPVGSFGGGGASSNTSNSTKLSPGKSLLHASTPVGLTRAKGLINNTKLESAIEKVLAKGKLSGAAIQNLLDLSAAVAGDLNISRSINETSNRTKVTVTIHVKEGKVIHNLMIHDTIPKAFANNASNITITVPGGSVQIVNNDPDVLISYPLAQGGSILTYSYTVNDSVASTQLALNDIVTAFATEAYASAAENFVCSQNAVKCSGNNVMVCSSNAWTVKENCPSGCNNGACIAAQPKSSSPKGGISKVLLTWLLLIGVVIIAAAVIIYVHMRTKVTDEFSKR